MMLATRDHLLSKGTIGMSPAKVKEQDDACKSKGTRWDDACKSKRTRWDVKTSPSAQGFARNLQLAQGFARAKCKFRGLCPS